MLRTLLQLVRSLRQVPTFSVVVLVTFALGIGATTALYSVVNHVLLRPLPYPQPERLVAVWTAMPEADIDQLAVAHAEYLDYRAESRLIDNAGAWAGRQRILTGEGEPAKLQVGFTTVSLWQVLGVEPLLGRTLVEGEDQPGAEPVAILSHALWQSRFGGDPAVIGRSIDLDSTAHRVVGVMPASFRFPYNELDLWVPFILDPLRRDNHHLLVLARRSAGVSVAQLSSEMETIVEGWSRLYDHHHPMYGVSYRQQLLGDLSRPLGLLLAATLLVLLIAAVNVAGLLLARGEARQSELALRAAIGSSRWRLVRSLVGESLLLAVSGGLLGLLVARVSLAAILAMAPAGIPRIDEVGLDPPVLGVAMALSLLAGLLAGLAPAWRLSRPDLVAMLRGGGRVASGSLRQRLRSVLVVAETATAVILVAGASVLLRNLWQLQQSDAGLDPDHVLTAQLTLPAPSYPSADETLAFYDRLLERLHAVPGVHSACLVNALPMRDSIRMILVGGPWQEPGDEPFGADVVMVSPGFFATLGNRVLAGRPFSADDRPGGQRVCALNETAARALLGERSAIGEPLTIVQAEPRTEPFEIVAVVRDIPTFGLGTEVRPQVYLPLSQAVTGIRGVTRSVSIALKTGIEPESMAGQLRAAVWSLDDQLPVTKVETMEQVVGASLQGQRFQTVLLLVFSGLALVLAAVGLYGLLAHLVGLRRRELGVRLALGARPGQVRTSVLGQGLRLTGLGLLLGIAGAVAAGRVIEGLAFGVSGSDPLSLLVTTLVLLAAATLACILPARRAARVDPVVILRNE